MLLNDIPCDKDKPMLDALYSTTVSDKRSFIWNMLRADITIQDLVVKYQLCVARVGIRLLVVSC